MQCLFVLLDADVGDLCSELCDVELDVLLLSDEVVDDQLVLPDVDVDDIAPDVLFELPDDVVQYLSADVHVDVQDHLVLA